MKRRAVWFAAAAVLLLTGWQQPPVAEAAGAVAGLCVWLMRQGVAPSGPLAYMIPQEARP